MSQKADTPKPPYVKTDKATGGKYLDSRIFVRSKLFEKQAHKIDRLVGQSAIKSAK